MNAAIRAVTRAAISKGIRVKGIYRGYKGLVTGEIQELYTDSVSNIIQRGGTMLKTARCAEFMTPEGRQMAYDNYETTDDHGMLLMGKAVDQIGNRYYKVKNSWSTENGYDGFYYVSIPYFRYKTLNIVVNKHAIPADLRAKMGIK